VTQPAGVKQSLDLGLDGCQGAELNPAHACSLGAHPSGQAGITACRRGPRTQGEPRELLEGLGARAAPAKLVARSQA